MFSEPVHRRRRSHVRLRLRNWWLDGDLGAHRDGAVVGEAEELGLACGVVGQGDEDYLAPGGEPGFAGAVQGDAGHEVGGLSWVEVRVEANVWVVEESSAEHFGEVGAVLEAEFGVDMHDAVPPIAEVLDGQSLVPWDVWNGGGAAGDDDGALVQDVVVSLVRA